MNRPADTFLDSDLRRDIQCPDCGYDLRGSIHHGSGSVTPVTCSECGSSTALNILLAESESIPWLHGRFASLWLVLPALGSPIGVGFVALLPASFGLPAIGIGLIAALAYCALLCYDRVRTVPGATRAIDVAFGTIAMVLLNAVLASLWVPFGVLALLGILEILD